jgi:DNA modification methylase
MTTWQNRIIGSGQEDPEQLLANPGNWRIHPRAQQDALSGVLDEVGWVDQIIVNQRTGHVVDGHLRVSLALRRNEPTVPVLYVDLSEAEEKLVLATLDPIAAMATADKEQLDALLQGVQTGDAAVQAMLAELANDSGLDYARPPVEDAEPQIDRAEELRTRWGVETGQLWQLGEHRIVCGDCTDKAVVERVMGGERAALALTDPPYNVGVAYDGDTVNDGKGEAEYEAFSRSWFALCQLASERQIVTPGCVNLSSWLHWFDVYHCAPWIKSNAVTNGKISRWWCWEPLLFVGRGWKRSRTNDIFDYPITMFRGTEMHPCAKTLNLWRDLIESYSEPDDVVLDVFLGSGTTLLACEQLGRRCRGIEISPPYCAVAIQRWVDVTGKEPKLSDS